MRQRRADDLGAELRERVDGAIVGGQHVRIDAHPLRVRHHGEPEPGGAARERRQRIGGRPRERLRVARIGPAQHAVDQGRVFHGARHGPGRVQGRGQRQDAVRADPPRRHLEPDDAAPRGGQPHRAARVGADGDGRQARAHGDTRATRRSARRPVDREVPGIPRIAHVRIRAPAPHGELDGVRLAEDDHPRGDEPLGEGRGDGRHALRPHLGAARGDAPLEVDQILERDGHAVERAHPVAGADRAIGALRGEHGVGFIHRDEGVQRGIAAANPLEQRLDGVHGRQGARAEGAGQLGDGGPHGIDRGHVRSPRCGFVNG